jgi:hypothetical protein
MVCVDGVDVTRTLRAELEDRCVVAGTKVAKASFLGPVSVDKGGPVICKVTRQWEVWEVFAAEEVVGGIGNVCVDEGVYVR